MKLSLIVITFNEEKNIGRCLASAEGLVDEMVVVDSFSTDRTPEIVREAGARLIQRPWPGGSSLQVAYATEQARHPWLLRLDGDEALSPELHEEIAAWRTRNTPPFAAYRVRRRDWVYDRWLRCSGKRLIRMGHRDLLYMPRRFSHGTWKTDCPVGQFGGYLDHYPVYLYHEWTAKLARRAYLRAQDDYRAGQHFHWYRLILHPLWMFFRLYILRFGWWDGYPGLLHSLGYAGYVLATQATLWELERGEVKLRALSEEVPMPVGGNPSG